ncbi:hypothetical protein HJB52_31870 [Rhizobium lentis]|uniref:hypothetical protein n=1 Tax=Rhizobium lentis TaxID=1138194 RepID=UPI001C836DC5|nr:hypothetical protein [Rhizobium lentis]MBX5106392.1 hypothetical protein [Rhizobium lentis]
MAYKIIGAVAVASVFWQLCNCQRGGWIQAASLARDNRSQDGLVPPIQESI